MAIKQRPLPIIPDHEVLRKIGGGAYGEVWLARGVTGALRAVKVVWREDFEDERTFEREFEGILRFEPISRDHPGLVNVLHVGRSPDRKSFYYYVMELGDDMLTGADINPIEYEPRTLRADSKDTRAKQFPIDECLDVGLRLAEALEHLHEKGLAHRDVKPSNIIFVGGKAKLADIGLVAARGQRTFVGTEGFVPPEGPGSAQADVYSLGKVLYEIATGKDRLDFPELPDEIPSGYDRKKWLALNSVICDVCDPHISKRSIKNAAELADALRRIQRGKRRRSRSAGIITTISIIVTGIGFLAWKSWESDSFIAKLQRFVQSEISSSAPVAPMGQIKIVSDPEGAAVFDEQGTYMGETQTTVLSYPVGTSLAFTLRKQGYQELKVSHTVAESPEPVLLGGALTVFSPPLIGQAWLDQFGTRYLPENDLHVSRDYVNERSWNLYLQAEKRPADAGHVIEISENGQPSRIVVTSASEAELFCRWLQRGATPSHLTTDQEILPRIESMFEHPALTDEIRQKNLKPFRVIVRQVPYGSIQVVAQPAGVEVYVNEESRGRIDGSKLIEKIRPGPVDLMFLLDGYKPQTQQFNLQNGERISVTIELKPNQGLVFGKPWENALGMKFVPVGEELMVSTWETRLQDYALFLQETQGKPLPKPDFAQAPDHPVVYIRRDDAIAFCQWLTARERKEERIQFSYEYRLPTDAEWSMMAGLNPEIGSTPGQRDAQAQLIWPWGQTWPPPTGSGNFADESAAKEGRVNPERIIQGYNDGFEKTAPVGSFLPNSFGIFDLSGNVHEWVSDDYDASKIHGVVRGGGWNSFREANLSLTFRHVIKLSSRRDNLYGFRVVIAKVPKETEPIPATPKP
jgi:serine/threonine protein kinase/formylglycine-generating enzyme required for sulfatase activity